MYKETTKKKQDARNREHKTENSTNMKKKTRNKDGELRQHESKKEMEIGSKSERKLKSKTVNKQKN